MRLQCLCCAAAVFAAPALARARAPQTSGPRETAHALSLAARASNFEYGGRGTYRFRFRSQTTAGISVEGGYGIGAFIAGYAVKRTAYFDARLPWLFPFLASDKFAMAFGLTPGLRRVRSFDPDGAPHDTSWAVALDTAVWSYAHLHERVTVKLGVIVPVSLQVSPQIDNDKVGGLIVTGLIVPLTDRLQWFADAQAGGIFGSNGDAGKFLVRGTTGVRLTIGANARRWRTF